MRLKVLAALACLPLASAAAQPSFSPAAIRAHVEFLADDLLEGREAGTRGYDLAARYVATRYGAMGLTAPVNGSWYQRVPLVRSRLVAGTPPTFTIGGRTFVHKDSVLMPPSLVETRQGYEGEVVFAGYCIDGLGGDDFAGLDVKGKLVACLSGFPKGNKSDIGAHLAGRKRLFAQARGALGVVSVQTRQSAKAFPWQRSLENADEPVSAWVQADGTAYREAPLANIGVALHGPAAEAMFAGAPRTLQDILDEADQGGRPRGFTLPQRVRYSRSSQLEPYESPNVLGMLPGSDPKVANEVVVMMAHLDHEGRDTSQPGNPIRNGAIDNAAGVATLLEVARALAESPARPRRSILFAAVTAEEMGLLGSHYLARHALPGGRVVAVVNLDAPILLYDFVDVIAFGAEHSTLGPIVADATGRAGVKSSPDPLPEQALFTRSDHYSFVKEGVPAVFLVTGFANGGEKHFREYLTTHYHRASDSLKLPFDWNAAAKFARINYEILRGIAEAPQRPLWYSDSLFGTAFAPKEPKARR